MNRETFLQQLDAGLAPLSEQERARVLDYYREMISDRLENGEEETACIAGLGAPHAVAAQILADSRGTEPAPELETGRRAAPSHDTGVYAASGQVRAIVVDARNVRVELVPVPSGPVRVRFALREYDRVAVSEENGVFTFQHTQQMLMLPWHMLLGSHGPLLVEVPQGFAGTLNIATRNASLHGENLSGLAGAELVTSNAQLILRGVHCRTLHAETCNGALELRDLCGESCTAQTSNAHLVAENCAFTELNLATGNAAIRASRLTGEQIELSNRNATITATICGDMREYAVHSHTSNAPNNLPPELCYPEQQKSLNVSTSNAKIEVRFLPPCKQGDRA